MALPSWTELSGSTLSEINERTEVNIALPLESTTGITVSIIAGSLPPGLRIENYAITGVAFEVSKLTQFDFVVRASNSDGIADRTYNISVVGADEPVWQTPEGPLAINKTFREQYWVDTLNTRWGIYETNAGTSWTEVTVTTYELIPSRTTGSDGDYAYVTSVQQYWYKVGGRWYRINETQIQGILGNDKSLVISPTVPNPNIDDFWLNTNKDNNGFDLKLKVYDDVSSLWRPQDITVSPTAPISPFSEQVWVQTFSDTFDFVLKVYNASDRTWEILNVTFSSTPPDRLNQAFFVLDSAPVDFQLEAIDADLPTGENLKYYIGDDAGELPPGLTLSADGKITGIVDPILALDIDADSGYDTGEYDSAPADFFVLDDDGFDSYTYDTTFYGFSTPTRPPKKLNRLYEFIVTVEDDVSFSKRQFSIYVVGDDFLRSDNTIMKAATGLFTADNTYLRKPLWLTPGNLGTKRAENYVTLFLEVYDPNALLGQISYLLQPFNDDGSISTLPPGLELDVLTGELAGKVPYQPAVSKEYKFTIEAQRQEVDDNDVIEINAGVYEDTLSGQSQLKINKLPVGADDGVSDLRALIEQNITIDNIGYTVESVDDSNTQYDLLNLSRGLEPTYKQKRIRTAFNNPIGQEYLYIYDDGDGRGTAWHNRTLKYSESEFYTLLYDEARNIPGTTITYNWQPMIRYTIRAADSAGILEFNHGVGEVPDTGNHIDDFVAYLTANGINTTEQYTEVSSSDDNKLYVFDIVRNSKIENDILHNNLFHTDDSVLDNIEITRSNQFFKVYLLKPLQRNFFLSNSTDEKSGVQLTLGVFKDTLISQKLNVTNIEAVSAIKTFTVTLLGEVDSTVQWKTDADLGTLPANRVSYLRLEATTTLAGSNLRYDIISGSLPNGMELKRDGELTGRPNQYSDGTGLGLTTIDNRTTLFDASTTTIDRQFSFRVMARDLFGYSAAIKTFTLTVTDTDDKIYSNVYIKPFLNNTQRQNFRDFINDYTVFEPESIYRPFDVNFGLQKDLKTLVYAGIEAKKLENFVAATALNTKRKRFYFGDIKTAIAKQAGSNDIVYEVVYVEIKDPHQPTNGNTKLTVTARDAQNLKVNQVKIEQKDDGTASETGQDIFEVTMRDVADVKIGALGGAIKLTTRTADIDVPAIGQLEVILNNGDVVVIRSTSTTTDASGAPFRFRPKTNVITVDNIGVQSSQSKNIKRYISNIGNMRKRIADIGANDRQFLPLWMRSNQTATGQELDYVTAMPLCYCKPGTSQTILENIQNANFDFKQINYDIDRYIVDRSEETSTDTFIVFTDYKLNV
tara:strand:+ start:2218 stop:6147 length:3930 start_codon:yes stop_codon:yes gene_type:complete